MSTVALKLQGNSRRGASRSAKAQTAKLRLSIPWGAIVPVVLLSLLTAAAYGGVQLLTTSFERAVARVSVSGDFQYLSHETVQQVISKHTPAGFFALDLQQIKNELEALPWVYGADVRRAWPDELAVYIREQEPVAVWQQDGFINNDVDVFFPQETVAIDALPKLNGAQGNQGLVLDSYRWLEPEFAAFSQQISALEIDAKGALRVETSSGLQVVFGSSDYVEKLARLKFAMQQGLSKQADKIRSIDLRYANGLAVAWIEEHQ